MLQTYMCMFQSEISSFQIQLSTFKFHVTNANSTNLNAFYLQTWHSHMRMHTCKECL
eukprot:c43782_g1_i1 orf=138-308(+)